MKKYILIVIGLIIAGLAIGGGIAYLNNANDSDVKTQSKITKTSDTKNTEDFKKIALEHQTARAKTIEEYKEEFKKDKKYKENCMGEKPIDYNMFDKNDINAANQAVACYQLKYDQKRGTKEADDEYIKFRDFYFNFMSEQYKQSGISSMPVEDVIGEGKSIDDKLKNPSLKAAIKKLTDTYYSYGLIVQYDEGSFMFSTSNKYLYENFSEYLSEPQCEFLKFNIQFDERIIYDGRYIVPKSVLEDNLKFYKEFKLKYPEYSKEHDIDKIIEYKTNAIKRYPIAY